MFNPENYSTQNSEYNDAIATHFQQHRERVRNSAAAWKTDWTTRTEADRETKLHMAEMNLLQAGQDKGAAETIIASAPFIGTSVQTGTQPIVNAIGKYAPDVAEAAGRGIVGAARAGSDVVRAGANVVGDVAPRAAQAVASGARSAGDALGSGLNSIGNAGGRAYRRIVPDPWEDAREVYIPTTGEEGWGLKSSQGRAIGRGIEQDMMDYRDFNVTPGEGFWSRGVRSGDTGQLSWTGREEVQNNIANQWERAGRFMNNPDAGLEMTQHNPGLKLRPDSPIARLDAQEQISHGPDVAGEEKAAMPGEDLPPLPDGPPPPLEAAGGEAAGEAAAGEAAGEAAAEAATETALTTTAAADWWNPVGWIAAAAAAGYGAYEYIDAEDKANQAEKDKAAAEKPIGSPPPAPSAGPPPNLRGLGALPTQQSALARVY